MLNLAFLRDAGATIVEGTPPAEETSRHHATCHHPAHGDALGGRAAPAANCTGDGRQPAAAAAEGERAAFISAKLGVKERQYSLEQLKGAATELIKAAQRGQPMPCSKACVHQGASCMRKTLNRLMSDVWEIEGWLARQDYIDEYSFRQKGNPTLRPRMFSADDDELLKAACTMAAKGGFGLTAPIVLEIMREIIVELEVKDPLTGELFRPGLAFVRKWMKRMRVKGYKSSSVAKERARKATEELAHEWFDLVAEYIRYLHSLGEVPWEDYSQVPEKCKYNMDEEAANVEKGRDRILMGKCTDRSLLRLFSIGHDGKMSRHVTDVMTTRADGKVCAPYVIKARGGKKARKRKAGESVPAMKATDQDGAELIDSDTTEDDEVLNVGIGITPSGSMTIEEFPRFCDHFNRYVIDADQGGRVVDTETGAVIKEGGQPVLLFLDGHASRWADLGFFTLMQNNIYPICVPSHTTIWSQPNDAGGNASFKLCIGRVLDESCEKVHMPHVHALAHAACTRHMHTPHAHATWTCRMDTRRAHATHRSRQPREASSLTKSTAVRSYVGARRWRQS